MSIQKRVQVGGLLLLLASPMQAAPVCSVYILRPLNFGSYNPFQVSANDSTARIEIKCVNNGRVRFEVLLSTGQAGTYFPRAMKLSGGSAQLNYNLYTNNARTKIWGDGNAGTYTQQGNRNSPFTKRYTLRGQIPPLQTAATVGAYSDTILVTVNY